jgi:hypothetical protein
VDGGHSRSAEATVGLALLRAACALGVAYAAVSIFWGLGGTWLLSTLGGSLEEEARSGSLGSQLLVWGAVVLKLFAAIFPLLVAERIGWAGAPRLARALCWAIGAVLAVYGGVLTAVGLAVQSGLLSASAHADHRALAWHAFLWDPWFGVWGLCVLLGLRALGPPTPRARRAVGIGKPTS